ncbi:MAG TPA: dihydrofolate reductase family protein [Polyangiaceae bacterium]|jgi:dihydrofolate reductase|nr:dihydrofolate reductase family protein [Polyangiaceae bacterium]
MRSLHLFNQITLDGYFSDLRGGMSFAHRADDEWTEFASNNAQGGGELVFGRVTYQMMQSFWPSEQAAKAMPVIAERMNSGPKVVFSRTLERATWNNTRLLRGDIAAEMRKLKAESGPDLVIMGSGSLVAPLAQARLIDSYQLVICPIVLGQGKTLFAGVADQLELELEKTRVFKNGNVVLWYTQARA